MIDRAIQAYLRDAVRIAEIKIFKAEIVFHDGKSYVYYFTSRFELGLKKTSASVYEKLESLRHILHSTN